MSQLKIVFLFFIVSFTPLNIFALTPPTHQVILCSIEGVVLRIEQAEASDALMNRIMVPTALMEISDIQPIEEGTTAEMGCNMPSEISMPDVFEGSKHINHYRICDEDTVLKIGDKLRAIVGRSLGGGPYCMEEVTIQE